MINDNETQLVYPMFDINKHVKISIYPFKDYFVSCNYGTVNPFTLGLWGKGVDGWYRVDEFYYSSQDTGIQLTDEEYYQKLKEFIKGRNINAVIIDPSAASFIETIKRHNDYFVIKAHNLIRDGIDLVRKALNNNTIFFYPCCKNIIKEFKNYVFDYNGKPKKENNRTMDDMRYFVSTVKI